MHWTIAAAALVALLVIVLFLVWTIGPSARRRRRLRHLERLLARGDFGGVAQQAAAIRGALPEVWQTRFDAVEAAALQKQGAQRLAAGDYENALAYLFQAAKLLGTPTLEPRTHVQNAMLDEIRRLFSATVVADTPTILALIERTYRIQSPCREASFWQGMCHLRDGDVEQALEHLQRSRTGSDRPIDEGESRSGPPAPPSPILDPALYIGAILLEQGKAKESLRYFTEANRLDSNTPPVPLHLGCAMIAAGGDIALAVRTLQKALKGLAAWKDAPATFWAEVYPENRSYVHKLASKYRFNCPLWGDGPSVLLRQGQLALAQGMQKLGQDEEAAALFDQALKEGATSVPVLRGLGLTLARLGRFADAYKPLRMAFDLENPKERLTSGFLALCAVKAPPLADADRTANLAWALKTVTPFSAPGDREWVELLETLFAEVRAAGLPIAGDDQLYLCEHLLSIDATDPRAIDAYEQMFREHSENYRPEYAWLYAHGVAEHGGGTEAGLPLFEMTLHERPTEFFQSRGWDLDVVEAAYLERAARAYPGHLPPILGPDPAPRIEALLLGRSKAAETAGDLDGARTAVETLALLLPDHPAALDRLASLHYRAGRDGEAIRALEKWQQARPDDPLPAIRLATLEARTEPLPGVLDRIRHALSRTEGAGRARVARWGARLALHAWSQGPPPTNGTHPPVDGRLDAAAEFLEAARSIEPADATTLAQLAAVHWLRGDHATLASLAEPSRAVEANDSADAFFLALPFVAAGDWAMVAARARSVSTGMTLTPAAAEATFLEGVAQSETGDLDAAIATLQKSACLDGSPTTPLAQAVLGSLLFRQGHFDTAAAWWQRLAPDRRAAWKLGEVLGNTQLLGALEEFAAGRFESAADRFRQAGKLGCRDRRLGGMLLLSLFRASRQALVDMPDVLVPATETPVAIEATLVEEHVPVAEAAP